MKLSLKQKLTLVVTVSLFLPFLLLGYLWYDRTERTIEQNASYYGKVLLEQANKSIDSYLSELDRLAIPFLLNPAIQSFLSLEPDDYYGQFLLQQKIRSELYKDLYSSRRDIYNFTIIMHEGLDLSSRDNSLMGERNRSYLKLLDRETDTDKFTVEGINRIDGMPVMTFYKIISDPNQSAHRGILIVDLKLTKIQEIMSNLSVDGVGEAFIVNESGQYYYHPQNSLIGTFADKTMMGQFADKNGFRVNGSDGQKSIVSYSTSALTGWTLVLETPMAHLTSGLVRLRTAAFLIFGCIAIVVLLMMGSFTYYLIRSLSFIQQLMKRAAAGNLNVRAPEKASDEIGMLFHSFNTMMDEYRRLIRVEHTSQLKAKEMQVRQKESMLIALQSQVNPHFLYNTLGTVHSIAILEGVRPISRIAANLANLFRYSLESDTQMVSLQEEIRYIEMYLDIQKERYEDLQTVIEMEAEARLKAIPCLRLMLQPLVENALLHGYQQYGQHPGYVAVIGRSAGACYEIRVIDHGQGMPADVRERYNAQFRGMTEDTLVDDAQWAIAGSIGLYNVHKRLRLVYGEPYGIWIEDSGTGGTVVRIVIPDNNEAV
ncbi:cache domain-containing sensor histidine kinase [Paenibacillus cymbidii]|uniref:cache domain-containing sensor histidine kinase n=1 Tax=Paenibacillus cymbidii TaxID=1639034 RepID=UPI001080C228|nr:histidine kinase [Paenibacillus cymbidii]